MSMWKKMLAEGLGTLWLVLGGCGSAVIALGFPDIGIGLLGVALAFGLSVLTAMYAFGPISGGHFNPAVTIGLVAAGHFSLKHVPLYVAAQVLGAIAGAGLVYLIASGKVGFELASGLGANGYSMTAALVGEFVMTAMFLLVWLGVTGGRVHSGFAPIAIGLSLTLIHLVSIPVTNTSVNPARSTGPALLVGSWALQQLWLFWLAPLLGATVAGLLWRKR
jgi:aquaporin Z